MTGGGGGKGPGAVAHWDSPGSEHEPEKGCNERGFQREDVVALFHFLDWLMRLPVELEQQLWQELKAEEEARKMHYVSNVDLRCQLSLSRQNLQEAIC